MDRRSQAINNELHTLLPDTAVDLVAVAPLVDVDRAWDGGPVVSYVRLQGAVHEQVVVLGNDLVLVLFLNVEDRI